MMTKVKCEYCGAWSPIDKLLITEFNYYFDCPECYEEFDIRTAEKEYELDKGDKCE